MGISMISAYEIVGHIETIELGLSQDGKKFGYCIMRGEDHNYKPIVSVSCGFSTKGEAVKSAIDVIGAVIAFCEEESKSKKKSLLKCSKKRMKEIKAVFEKRREEFLALAA